MTPLITGLVGVGILFGLLFLGTQVRANARAVRAETFQAMVGQSTRLLESLYANAEVAELLAEGRVHRWEDLTPIQQVRANSALLAIFRTFDNMVFQHQEGTVDKEFWEGTRRLILLHSSQSLWRAWFVENRDLFSSRLQDLVQNGRWDL